jgi:riboflavin synthase
MFTGIIEALGRVAELQGAHGGMRIRIESAELGLDDVHLGDSIAVNGVCLTVTEFSSRDFCADISAESLRYTRFASMRTGDTVNLEKALTLSKPLGGHLVSGHVDGIGSIVAVSSEGDSLRYTIECEQELTRYIANKGSVCVDGVSLTVTGLVDSGFTLNIVPHTATNTIIPGYKSGAQVHLEVDLMARYAERLLQVGQLAEPQKKSVLDEAFLARNGYKI